jgi:hypothetical protein
MHVAVTDHPPPTYLASELQTMAVAGLTLRQRAVGSLDLESREI